MTAIAVAAYDRYGCGAPFLRSGQAASAARAGAFFSRGETDEGVRTS